jgi:hypothetical protein
MTTVVEVPSSMGGKWPPSCPQDPLPSRCWPDRRPLPAA